MSNDGRKFKLEDTIQNHWTIISFIGRKNKRNVYHCKCQCGTEKDVLSNGSKLISKCCGCKRSPHYRKGIKSPAEKIDIYSTLRTRYKKDAKSRNLVFALTKNEFQILVTGPCYYCNKRNTSKQMYNNWGFVEYTGIDRVDNNVGYILKNCVSCCKSCNIIKKAVTPEIIKKAYNFLFGENNVL